MRVKCKDGCEWEAYCTKLLNEDYWKLRKVVNIHSSNKEYNVKIVSTKWLRKRIQNSLKNNPRIKIKNIKEIAPKKWNVKSTRLRP